MTLSSVLAISSQMGSCRTHLMNCSSPSPPALLLPPAGCLREWSFSEESMLPKYLLVWLPWLLPVGGGAGKMSFSRQFGPKLPKLRYSVKLH